MQNKDDMSDVSAENNLTVYVYYKIPANDHNMCLLAVKNLDEKIRFQYPQLKIQHQKRPKLDAEDKETWMETYAGISSMELEKFTADLAELAKLYGLTQERRSEIFVTL